jgi:predicted transcriptional regulator
VAEEELIKKEPIEDKLGKGGRGKSDRAKDDRAKDDPAKDDPAKEQRTKERRAKEQQTREDQEQQTREDQTRKEETGEGRTATEQTVEEQAATEQTREEQAATEQTREEEAGKVQAPEERAHEELTYKERVEENRLTISQPEVMSALTHPVRLNLLNHLMAAGPATASQCARAVGDTPSNCSYHLRTLARHGLVAPEESRDGRERPYRALITGLSVEGINDEPGSPRQVSATAFVALAVQLEQQRVRDYLTHRDRVPQRWREADSHGTYTLRMTPEELNDLGERLDALIRPFLAATRADQPTGTELVHLGLHAFPTDSAAPPKDSAALPTDSAALPKDSAALPKDSAALPKDSAALPKDSGAFPKDPDASRKEKHAFPKEKHTLPEEQHGFPNEQHILLQEHTLPEEQAT